MNENNPTRKGDSKKTRTPMSPEAKIVRAEERKRASAERRVRKARLKKAFVHEFNIAGQAARRRAEQGQMTPIHFDVRVRDGDLIAEEQLSLIDVQFCADCFSGEPIAVGWLIRARAKCLPPDFVHEGCEAIAATGNLGLNAS
jgi:hypothetical protein